MKKFILSLLLLPALAMAQDTSRTHFENKKFHHEIGFNATNLMKQVLNFSNLTFNVLPYDLTYKLIRKNHAYRFGMGITMDNSSQDQETVITSSGVQKQPDPAPDQNIPTVSNSYNVFYRAGIEKRYNLSNKFLFAAGFDLIGQIGKTESSSSILNNNLPNNYNFSKTSDKTNTFVWGAGPVLSIQYAFSRRISIFTELPVYYSFSTVKDETYNYTKSLNQFQNNNNFVTTESTKTSEEKRSRVNINLPVTIYLAFKF